jgi:large subunit ribosomal protein L18
MKIQNKTDSRRRRHRRVRRKISGTAERPRMAIMKSSRHLYVQLIDDVAGVTLASATTVSNADKCNIATAGELGKAIAKAGQEKGIERVVVDRGGFPFHGRIKAVVDGAVEAGLSILSNPVTAEPSADEKEES